MASLLRYFETSRHQYIYDAGTNRIVRANHAICDIARLLHTHTHQEIFDRLKPAHDAATLEREYAKVTHLRDEYGLFATSAAPRRISARDEQ